MGSREGKADNTPISSISSNGQFGRFQSLISLQFMIYGFLQCVDCFLYICSYLPLRILFVMLQAFHNPFAIRQK